MNTTPCCRLLDYKQIESLVWSLPCSHVVATAALTRWSLANMADIPKIMFFKYTSFKFKLSLFPQILSACQYLSS